MINKCKIISASNYPELQEEVNKFIMNKMILFVSYSEGPAKVSAMIVYKI